VRIRTAGSSSARRPVTTTPADGPLIEALAASQRLGMIGAVPLADVVDHSVTFVDAVAGVSGTVVDLGSGGGVPGLVIAWRRPDLRLILVDRRTTRADHLRRLVTRLGLSDRVSVLAAEAREMPHLLENRVEAVVARGFGAPRVVLDAVRPILADMGIVIVSEPPQGPDRWPIDVVGEDFIRLPSEPHIAVLARVPRGTS
jgi:16S rRNA (guanine527-N7)-methyltransferase